ncbi:MAG: hypothetical protein AAF253_00700 [Pseudomonadota bacterium]
MLKSLVTRVSSPRRAIAYGWLLDGLGLVIGLVFVSVLAFLIFGAGEGVGATLAAALGLIALGGLALATLERLGELLEQWSRDLRAQDLLDRIERGKAVPPFVLYLRPFASTDAVQAHDFNYLPKSLPGFGGGNVMAATVKYELENEIRQASRAIGPMVALGAPLEHVGAGRILVSDGTWQRAIAGLMDAAALIVLLPSSRAGTAFEVNRILDNGLLGKTVIIDPPNGSTSALDGYDHAQEWDDIRDLFAAKGVDLPADDRRGRAYGFTAGGETLLDRRVDIDGTGMRPFLKQLTRLRAGGAEIERGLA